MDTNHVGTTIRDARERLGLTEEFCARKCGLSIPWYCDVETSDDEFFDNISLGTARRLCLLLGLDLVGLTAQHLKLNIAERSVVDDVRFYSRNNLIARTRLKKNMTETDLADAIGFETIIIEGLERSPDYIECLPIMVVVDLAAALNIDPGHLVCNRDGMQKR